MPARLGICSLSLGVVVNYVAEGRSFGTGLDILLATIAFFLTITGLMLFIIALWRRLAAQSLFRSLLLTLAICIPLSAFYGAFYFGMQFLQTGADKYGECPGLVDAAAASNDVPTSELYSPKPAVYCGNERSGMFFWPYNSLSVFGVTDPVAQDRVVKNVSKYHREANTFSVRIAFYDRENRVQREGTRGAVWNGLGPMKIIRCVNLR
jgi:hypothetical protein